MTIKNLFYLILLTGIIYGCNSKPEKKEIVFPGTNEIIGLASRYDMNEGANTLYLEDYFIHPEKIDSVSFSSHVDFEYFPDKNEVIWVPTAELPQLFTLKTWINGIPWSILIKKPQKAEIEFVFDPAGRAYKNIRVAGEMNAWNPANSNFELINGLWKFKMLVNPGKYQYRLVVDGNWILDPQNPDSVDNNIGAYNSLLVAGEDVSDKVPEIFTVKYEDNIIYTGNKNPVSRYIVFWQNFDISYNFINGKIKIPNGSQKIRRSYIRVYACNEYGPANDLLIPLEYGKVITDPGMLTRSDKQSMILYNVFVDRFYDADSSNDKPLHIPEVRPKADNMGGDIAGVTEKIESGYFTRLGVNSIWLSPVVKNAQGAWGQWPDPKTKFSAYHGYWPVSFTETDKRFGTPDDLLKLTQTAHGHKLNLLLDFVANHVHQDHPVIKAHPDWATDLYLPDGTLNTEKWDEHRLTTWFDVFLPTLDLSKPEVYNMLSDSAVYWIKTYNLDGFRHDATKHIPEIFWRTLTRKLKEQVIVEENRDIFQIGETYGTRELVGSYVNSGELDAQFDFNVYDASVAAFAKNNYSFQNLSESLHESFKYFGWHHLMGNISGNQDKGRFISYAGGALRFDEDAKQAGWTRKVGVGNEKAYEKLKLLFAFNFTIPGVPVIYYGDEIGMPGGNDPDNRRMMRFENLTAKELNIKTTVSRLAWLRKNSIPLMYGDFQELMVEDNIWVYCRTYFDKIAVIVLNKSGQEQNIEFIIPERFANSSLSSNFHHEFVRKKETISIKIPACSFEILTH